MGYWKTTRRKIRRSRPEVRRAPSASAPNRRAGIGDMAAGGGLTIGGVHDPAEKAADRTADRVMRMTAPTPLLRRKCAACEAKERAQRMPGIRRKCAACEEEDKQARRSPAEISRSAAGGMPLAPGAASAPAPAHAASAIRSMGPGRAMATAERAFFEPRFGADLSPVRIHDDPGAERASASIQARAFTVGNDIAFARDEYAAGTESGRRLMAHELAHVVGAGEDVESGVRRTVGANLTCPANVDNAPADPLGRLATIDAEASRIALGTHNLLSVAAIELNFYPDITAAYRHHFGNPPASGNKFKNRFTNSKHNTRDAALMSEMETAANLFRRISQRFDRPIRYRCSGTHQIKLENCSPARCATNDIALSCPGSSLRDIQLCPGFWNMTNQQLAGALVHELVHGELNRPGHPQPVGQRHRNPECFTSLAADIYGFVPFDVRCPTIP